MPQYKEVMELEGAQGQKLGVVGAQFPPHLAWGACPVEIGVAEVHDVLLEDF